MEKASAASATFALLILVLGGIILLGNINNCDPTGAPEVEYYGYTIINIYPHDPTAFTQGLTYVDGQLYESTGLKGSSTLRRVDLASGNILAEVSLPMQYFGEGMAVVNDLIIQLTWRSQVGMVYDKETLTLVRTFSYTSEGWGLTFDGIKLIMSNGSDYLQFLDPATLQQVGEVHVHEGNFSINSLNELEYINGDVYANIFLQNKIAIINPNNGQVKGWIDLTSLEGASDGNSESVLNGIAYDAKNNRLFVTGKNWPHLYEIELVSSSTYAHLLR